MQVTIILVPAKALASNPVSRRLQPRTPRLPACSPLLPPSPLKPLKLLKLLNLPKFLNLLKLLILSVLMLPCHNFGAARALQRLFFAAVAALSSRAACALQHPSSLKNLFPLWRLSAPLPQNSQALNLFSSFPLKFVSAQRFSTHFSPNSQASNPFSSFPLKFALAQRFSTPSAEVSLSWALSPNSLSSLISLSSLSSQPSCSLATILVPLGRFCIPKRAQRTSCSSALVAF